MRAALFRLVRSFFAGLGFLEVDTPVRQPVIIPEKNIVPLQSGNWFLQASPELCMKRLLAAGCEKVFQICPCFRAEERGRLHLQEFVMLEWYRRGGDYTDLMMDCHALLVFIKENLQKEFPRECSCLHRSCLYGGESVDVAREGRRLTVEEAFQRFSPVSLQQALETDRFEELLVENVEPHLGWDVPFFLYDYPRELASLAKYKSGNSQVAERFELYISGVELANGFSELTDADEQRRRFEGEIQYICENNQFATAMPERFLQALDHLEAAAGAAFGLDRLFMLILGKGNLDEAVTFSPSDL